MNMKNIKLFHILLILLSSIVFYYLYRIHILLKSFDDDESSSSELWLFDYNNYEIITDQRYKTRLSQCKNEVYYDSRKTKSIWTFLVVDKKNDLNYAQSAIKLIKSIKMNTNDFDSYEFFILELSEKPLRVRFNLETSGWKICTVDRIPPRDELKTYPKFRDQFTKLVLWNMTQFKTVNYFDSDTFVIGNIDILLNMGNHLNEVKKIGVTRDIRDGRWQQTFNMGVFVIQPNQREFERLIKLKDEFNFKYEDKMAEQGFLNEVYKSPNDWYDIGFEYNANLAAYTDYWSVWKKYEKDIRVIHFTMTKPWNCWFSYQKICDLWIKF